MLQLRTVVGLAVVLGGADAIVRHETMGPDTPDLVSVDGAARGTLGAGMGIQAHPSGPIDVVSILIKLDSDGDGLVNGGPAIVTVTGAAGSAVTIYDAGSCEKHVYRAADAFVEGDMIHSAWNESGKDLVLRGTLLPVGAAPTVLEPNELLDRGKP